MSLIFQTSLRSACKASGLGAAARLLSLEVLELRAMNWVSNELVASYYKLKLDEVPFGLFL